MREWVEFNKGANINAMNKKKNNRIQRKCTKPNNWKQTILNTIFCLVVTNTIKLFFLQLIIFLACAVNGDSFYPHKVNFLIWQNATKLIFIHLIINLASQKCTWWTIDISLSLCTCTNIFLVHFVNAVRNFTSISFVLFFLILSYYSLMWQLLV